MMPNPPPTVDAIHQYDQAHKRRLVELDNLIAATRASLKTHRREVAIAGVSCYFRDEMSHNAVAEILSCAIERLIDIADHPTR